MEWNGTNRTVTIDADIKPGGFLFGSPRFERVTIPKRGRRTLEPSFWREPHPDRFSDLFQSIFFETWTINGKPVEHLFVAPPMYTDGATIPTLAVPIAALFGVTRFGKFFLPALHHDCGYEQLWSAYHSGTLTIQAFKDLKLEMDWIFREMITSRNGSTLATATAYWTVKQFGFIEWGKL